MYTTCLNPTQNRWIENYQFCFNIVLIKNLKVLFSCRYKWLPNRRGGVSGFGQAPASRRQDGNDNANGGRHAWGRGNQLGD